MNRNNSELNKDSVIEAVEISPNKYKALEETVVKMIKKRFTEDKGTCPHVVVCYRQLEDSIEGQVPGDEMAGVFEIDSDNFDDPQTKKEIIFGIGVTVFLNRWFPAATFLASEAWCVKRNKQEELPKGRVSECDDKEEVLVVFGRSISRDDSSQVVIPITRSSDGSVITGNEERATTSEQALLDFFFAGYFYLGVLNSEDEVDSEKAKNLFSYVKHHKLDSVALEMLEQHKKKTGSKEDESQSTAE